MKVAKLSALRTSRVEVAVVVLMCRNIFMLWFKISFLKMVGFFDNWQFTKLEFFAVASGFVFNISKHCFMKLHGDVSYSQLPPRVSCLLHWYSAILMPVFGFSC
jgi:hypothetical protein